MTTRGGPSDDITALDGIVGVSRETAGKLERFVALLRTWQQADNLVAPGTLPQIWRRHVADSAQLTHFFPDARTWLDLGSGAGFPGLVTAILLAGAPGAHVDLVESNRRKAAFLRRAIRDTGAPAEVHTGRIESVPGGFPGAVAVVSARALAPLDRLLTLAAPVLKRGACGAFHKGQDFGREIDKASKSWNFDLVKHDSLVGDGVILEIRRLVRKTESRPTGVRGQS